MFESNSFKIRDNIATGNEKKIDLILYIYIIKHIYSIVKINIQSVQSILNITDQSLRKFFKKKLTCLILGKQDDILVH